MKRLIQNLLGKFGYEIHRTQTLNGFSHGSATRPIGNLKLFLEDIRARGFKPQGIIDVGAFNGDWTKLGLSIFPNTPVLMIEPQDEMQPFLSEIAKFAPNCYVVKAGCGRKAGEQAQTIWEDHAGSSFLPVADSRLAEAGKQRKSKVVTIDETLSNDFPNFIPDLVKLDIQGFELEALSGGEKLFGKTEIFILEVSLFPFIAGWPLAREVILFMSARGYELYDIPGYGRRPHDGALGQLDLAFVKSNGQFRKVSDW
jgi:FkbM family methyltransferase